MLKSLFYKTLIYLIIFILHIDNLISSDILLSKEVNNIGKIKKSEVSRDFSDYQENLEEQLHFIVNACKMYDQGELIYAKQIATHIRILVHDTKFSTSLLKLLNRKESMKFCSTATFPKNPIFHISFISPINIRRDDKIINTFVPNFNETSPGENKKWVDFNTWYNHNVLVSKPNYFSRKDMILYLSNKDGGAHIDPNIEERYYEITKGLKSFLYSSAVSLTEDPYHKGEPYLNLYFASVRQIAHELILSIRKEFGIRPDYNPSFKSFGINGLEPQDIMVVEGDKIEYEF